MKIQLNNKMIQKDELTRLSTYKYALDKQKLVLNRLAKMERLEKQYVDIVSTIEGRLISTALEGKCQITVCSLAPLNDDNLSYEYYDSLPKSNVSHEVRGVVLPEDAIGSIGGNLKRVFDFLVESGYAPNIVYRNQSSSGFDDTIDLELMW